MDFETRSGRLRLVSPRMSVWGCEDVRLIAFRRTTITVDGRVVRDVIDGGCGHIVVELDGSESRVP